MAGGKRSTKVAAVRGNASSNGLSATVMGPLGTSLAFLHQHVSGPAPETNPTDYTERLRGHVLPALGHLRLREIQRGHIKLFLGEKRRQGYAKNSVRLMKASLSALLSDAADDGIIPAKPAFQLGRRKASRADKLTPAERLQRSGP